MNQVAGTASEGRGHGAHAPRLDAQYAELMEMVWACERSATREDRIDAVLDITFGGIVLGSGRTVRRPLPADVSSRRV